MEAMKEKEAGFLRSILPPRLEDAGLEECALPPDSIKEAFLKAAIAVKSRVPSIFNSDEDEDSDIKCVKDPWSEAKDRSYEVVGVIPEGELPGSCSSDKGVGTTSAVGGDDVVLVGGDKVSKGEKACVEGLEDLDNGEKKVDNDDGDDDEEKGKRERPILTEGFV